jgi:hypothetical protein
VISRRTFLKTSAATAAGALASWFLVATARDRNGSRRSLRGFRRGGFTVPPGETWEIRGTVRTDGNVVVRGTLRMRPPATLRFVNVNESRFVGGGMHPVRTDVGLWVIGSGVLDAQGTSKEAWNRVGDHSTWKAADDLVALPVARGDFVPHPHTKGSPPPSVSVGGRIRTAEVLNLSRDVRIEGTPGGRTHIFIRSRRRQRIKNVLIRYVGPRQPDGDGDSSPVLGRYGLHFHMCGKGSKGTVVRGVVIRDSGAHCFVPHNSNGITFRECISYDSYEDAYWWDDDGTTNGTRWENCVAALVKSDPPFRGFRLHGFRLSNKKGNACRGCVASAVQGNVDAAGFGWPEGHDGVWGFEDNVAHNNAVNGIFVWQNGTEIHPIRRFTAYHNGESGVSHGAYGNNYAYEDLELVGNREGIEHKADSAGTEDQPPAAGPFQTWRNVLVRDSTVGMLLSEHAFRGNVPTRVEECRFDTPVPVRVDEAGESPAGVVYEFVRCTTSGRDLEPTDFHIVSKASTIRGTRRDGSTWQV